jgi:hypothetical protein
LLQHFSSEGLRTRFNIVAGGLIQLVVLYFPMIAVMAGLFFKKKLKPDYALSLVAAATVLLSLLGWAVLYLDLNAVQIFSNIGIVTLNVFFAIMLIELAAHPDIGKPYLKIVFALLLLPFLFQVKNSIAWTPASLPHATAYLSAISQQQRKNNLKRGVSIKARDRVEDLFSKYNVVYPLGDYLSLMDDRVFVVNIGDFDTPIDSSSVVALQRSKKAIELGFFYRQVLSVTGGVLPDQKTIEASQVEFIRKYDIQFVILSAKASLPSGLAPFIDVALEDQFTKERFIVLKRNGR